MIRCDACRFKEYGTSDYPCSECDTINNMFKPKAITNADKIRGMSDLELAELLATTNGEEMQEKCPNYKSGCWYECTIEHACENAFSKTLYLNWLQSEAEY